MLRAVSQPTAVRRESEGVSSQNAFNHFCLESGFPDLSLNIQDCDFTECDRNLATLHSPSPLNPAVTCEVFAPFQNAEQDIESHLADFG